ncbi:sensor histidine kinase [Deinococcus aquaedulcis]|uniref:sensor histidine kinase n=1 Tax=Deinococcus aquaedulcis TaxID=2840455 RepID=UPI001C82832B|nr:ATP-binding protein [Deinococcus aquaedulcis]
MTHDLSPLPRTLSAPDPQLQGLEAQIQALQSALAQARALFHSAPHAAFLVNAQGRVVEINALGAALLGTDPALALGRPLAGALTPESRSVLAALLGAVFAGRGPQRAEVQVALEGGERLDLSLSAALHAGGDEPLCHLSAADVTAFKAAHRTLLASTQGLEQDLRQQTARFRQLGEEFRTVMAVSENQLSTTLTRAQNFLGLMDRQECPADRQRSLGHVVTAVQETQGLLTSLKSYMQARTIRARMRSLDLNRVLREVLKDLEAGLAGRHVQISQVPLPVVQGDHQVLQIILHEYLTNALKFTRTRPQARLRLLVQETEKEHWVGVEDNGVGFNMRQKEKAFELFGRLHPVDLYEGTGLGLAVVRRLCERFGGRAWGEGKVDQGATFWFAWPKTPVPD